MFWIPDLPKSANVNVDCAVRRFFFENLYPLSPYIFSFLLTVYYSIVLFTSTAKNIIY